MSSTVICSARSPHLVGLVLALALLPALLACYPPPRPAPPATIYAPAMAVRQASVDAGYDVWRTDPLAVVRSEIMRYGGTLSWDLTAGQPYFDPELSRWRLEVRVTNPRDPADVLIFQVSQPARQGEGGIWVVHDIVRTKP